MEFIEDFPENPQINYSKNAPVVNPISDKIIFDKIHSYAKKLIEVDFENHVIITAKNKEMVFQEIINFFNQQKII